MPTHTWIFAIIHDGGASAGRGSAGQRGRRHVHGSPSGAVLHDDARVGMRRHAHRRHSKRVSALTQQVRATTTRDRPDSRVLGRAGTVVATPDRLASVAADGASRVRRAQVRDVRARLRARGVRMRAGEPQK